MAFWRKARWSILLLVGHVWRRMVKEYEKWPWPLATSVDPRETIESRRASAQDVFDANTCSLDPGFLRRLRKVVLNIDAFFTDEVQSFVFFMFANAVFSTCYVECLFASYKQWTQKSAKPGKMSNLAAKHVTHVFNRANAAQERRVTFTKRRKLKRCRPAWVRAKRGRNKRPAKCTTSHSVFLGEFVSKRVADHQAAGPVVIPSIMSSANAAWREASVEEKARARKEAKKRRKGARKASADPCKRSVIERTEVAAVGGDPVERTAWGLGQGDFALNESAVKAGYEKKRSLATSSSSWQNQYGGKTDPGEPLPAKVPRPTCCRDRCPVCKEELDPAVLASYETALTALRVTFAPRGKPMDYGKVAMLTRDGLQVFVEFISGLKSPFRGEFLRYDVTEPFVPECPFILTAGAVTQYDLELLNLVDEQTLAMELATTEALDISTLEYEPVIAGPAGFDKIRITAMRRLDVASEIQREQDVLAAKRAVRLLRGLQQPRPQPSPCEAGRGGRGNRGGRGRGCGARGRGRAGGRGGRGRGGRWLCPLGHPIHRTAIRQMRTKMRRLLNGKRQLALRDVRIPKRLEQTRQRRPRRRAHLATRRPRRPAGPAARQPLRHRQAGLATRQLRLQAGLATRWLLQAATTAFAKTLEGTCTWGPRRSAA